MQSEAIKRIHLGAPFGEHLSMEAISMQSDAIKRFHLGAPFGEHLSREAIKKPSEAIRGHQRPSEVTRRPTEAITWLRAVKTRDDKIALELPITIALSSIFGSDGAGATATEPRPVPKHVGCMTRTVTPADRFASCAGPMASSVNA